MQKPVSLVAMFALLLLVPVSAIAEVRDISFAAQAQTAKVLFSFDRQPSAVKVFITENGLDVDVLGVEARAAILQPASAALFVSVRTIPAPGGLRLRLDLRDIPIAAKADVFQGAILVTATFVGDVQRPRDAVVFANVGSSLQTTMDGSIPTPITADKIQHKQPIDTLQVEISKPSSPALVQEPELERGYDGGVDLDRVPVIKPVGTGMIREASLRVAGDLSQEQCDASEAAVKADPWALDNLARFGSCLSREGKTKEAREVFERLLTFDPETFAAYVGLGAIAQDAGETKTARQYYEEALALGGSDQQAAQARDLLVSLGEE